MLGRLAGSRVPPLTPPAIIGRGGRGTTPDIEWATPTRALEPLRVMLRRERDAAAKATAKRAIRMLEKQASSAG
jgi:hypothetical protein